MYNDSYYTRKSFSDSMDQSSSDEGKRAPSNGERANYQTYERAILMKHSIGFEWQISAKAKAAEEGEE
jgi:hypothetical protein